MENAWPLRDSVFVVWVNLDRSDILEVFEVSDTLLSMGHLSVLDRLIAEAQRR